MSAKDDLRALNEASEKYDGPLPCFESEIDHRDVKPGEKCPGCGYVASEKENER